MGASVAGLPLPLPLPLRRSTLQRIAGNARLPARSPEQLVVDVQLGTPKHHMHARDMCAHACTHVCGRLWRRPCLDAVQPTHMCFGLLRLAPVALCAPSWPSSPAAPTLPPPSPWPLVAHDPRVRASQSPPPHHHHAPPTPFSPRPPAQHPERNSGARGGGTATGPGRRRGRCRRKRRWGRR